MSMHYLVASLCFLDASFLHLLTTKSSFFRSERFIQFTSAELEVDCYGADRTYITMKITR